ncbi:hypothetical protein Mgra_00003320 [Meloidogyne graminicola]|uniref:Uncharacterized protein n=1 Tax=Meloidogyne graminicola TaxID=189291 RepID=A0A8S9ZV66_9BILA|nr:hypothetical protein Mgra_00003320 [Meloidogyne graminicola]
MIDIESKNNLFDRLKNYMHFLLNCCPNLEYMEFKFTNNSIDPLKYITELEIFITSIIDYLKSSNLGGKNLRIRMGFTANFEETLFETIPNDHKLLSLGKAFVINELTDDSPYVAHIIEFNYLIGRQHECVFQIYSERPDLSDYDPSIYYDSGHYFGHSDYQYYDSDYYDSDGEYHGMCHDY